MSKMQAAQIAIAKRRAEVGKLKQIISDQDPLATAVRDAIAWS